MGYHPLHRIISTTLPTLFNELVETFNAGRRIN
jgi:hypothetical protein